MYVFSKVPLSFCELNIAELQYCIANYIHNIFISLQLGVHYRAPVRGDSRDSRQGSPTTVG